MAGPVSLSLFLTLTDYLFQLASALKIYSLPQLRSWFVLVTTNHMDDGIMAMALGETHVMLAPSSPPDSSRSTLLGLVYDSEHQVLRMDNPGPLQLRQSEMVVRHEPC